MALLDQVSVDLAWTRPVRRHHDLASLQHACATGRRRRCCRAAAPRTSGRSRRRSWGRRRAPPAARRPARTPAAGDTPPTSLPTLAIRQVRAQIAVLRSVVHLHAQAQRVVADGAGGLDGVGRPAHAGLDRLADVHHRRVPAHAAHDERHGAATLDRGRRRARRSRGRNRRTRRRSRRWPRAGSRGCGRAGCRCRAAAARAGSPCRSAPWPRRARCRHRLQASTSEAPSATARLRSEAVPGSSAVVSTHCSSPSSYCSAAVVSRARSPSGSSTFVGFTMATTDMRRPYRSAQGSHPLAGGVREWARARLELRSAGCRRPSSSRATRRSGRRGRPPSARRRSGRRTGASPPTTCSPGNVPSSASGHWYRDDAGASNGGRTPAPRGRTCIRRFREAFCGAGRPRGDGAVPGRDASGRARALGHGRRSGA